MILIDTSVWADHFNRPTHALLEHIAMARVVHHPFVTGELALGNPANCARMVQMLDALPTLEVANHASLMRFIEAEGIGGTGIGFVDAHLLAACALSATRLWTRDKRLAEQAEKLGLLHPA